eukprot:159820-Chlamydomonas_euryale.AAC.5
MAARRRSEEHIACSKALPGLNEKLQPLTSVGSVLRMQSSEHVHLDWFFVCVKLQLWTAQPTIAEWIRRGQPAHTPPQRPPAAEREGRHKSRKGQDETGCQDPAMGACAFATGLKLETSSFPGLNCGVLLAAQSRCPLFRQVMRLRSFSAQQLLMPRACLPPESGVLIASGFSHDRPDTTTWLPSVGELLPDRQRHTRPLGFCEAGCACRVPHAVAWRRCAAESVHGESLAHTCIRTRPKQRLHDAHHMD